MRVELDEKMPHVFVGFHCIHITFVADHLGTRVIDSAFFLSKLGFGFFAALNLYSFGLVANRTVRQTWKNGLQNFGNLRASLLYFAKPEE